MATDEEIYDSKLDVGTTRKLKSVLEAAEYTASVLFAVAEYLKGEDDSKAGFIVEQAAWKLAAHEAEHSAQWDGIVSR